MTGNRRRNRRTLVAAVAFVAVASASLSVGPAGADAVSDKRSEAAQISTKLAELDARQMDLNAQYEQANYALHQADAKVDEAQRQADETNAQLESRRAELQTFSVQAYVTGNDSNAANALLTSDPSSGVEKRAYVQATSGNRQDIVDSLDAAQQAAADDAAQLDAAQKEAATHAQEIEKARSQASAAADEQRALNDKAQGELASLVAEETAKRQAAAAAATTTTAPAAAAGPSTTTGAAARSAPAPAATAPGPVVTPPSSPPPPPAGSGGSGAISAALSRMGDPYVWGAAGPSAFDCSGLVAWAYAQVGVSLPHYSGAQYAMTTRISESQLQPGDLVFWGPGGSDHVAIYMGGGQLVHTFRNPEGVTTTPLDGWWKPPSGFGRLNR